MHYFKLFVIAFAISTSVNAQTSNGKFELGKQLVELVDLTAGFSSFDSQCKQHSGTLFDPNVMFRNNKSAFGPLTPSSIYWPRIEAAYKTYHERVCAEMSSGSVKSKLAADYAERLSVEELQMAIAFYSSDTGKHLRTVNLETMQALALTSTNPNMSKYFEDIGKAVQSIFNEYAMHPG
ncbi:MAG: DUF2059 domain-containing protein [Rhodoferax sp.]|nr:DUF2059 domain-containing protein [Rhodoferax sp.]MDP3651234.1 DUF2059 domain-containing protein [Rhodoferax sp.]